MEMMAQEHDLTAFNEEFAKEMTQAVSETTVSGYIKIENGVVGGYKKIEDGVVKGFGKVVDKCVEVLFARDGESVEDASFCLSTGI